VRGPCVWTHVLTAQWLEPVGLLIGSPRGSNNLLLLLLAACPPPSLSLSLPCSSQRPEAEQTAAMSGCVPEPRPSVRAQKPVTRECRSQLNPASPPPMSSTSTVVGEEGWWNVRADDITWRSGFGERGSGDASVFECTDPSSCSVHVCSSTRIFTRVPERRSRARSKQEPMTVAGGGANPASPDTGQKPPIPDSAPRTRAPPSFLRPHLPFAKAHVTHV
jgi:hypothetical protein